MRLVLAIRSLNIGGAERQFIELVKNIDKNKFKVYVISMYGGVLENEVLKSGVKYYNLKKSGRYDINFYFKYKKLLQTINPDVIYSFMGEMNLFSYWTKPKHTKIIWGFRASDMDLKKYGKMSQFLFWLQKKYSKNIDKIITNSNASLQYHKKMGFFMDRAVVVYNGIDIKRFSKKTSNFKKEFHLKDIVIGMVARVDYIKGYDIFCEVAKEYKNIDFIAIGDGDEKIKRDCKNVKFLGSFKEIEKVYNGIDILVSASKSEGFSNSIAEAMACEVPCVVSDVGDSRFIVGECGEVIKPNSIKDLKKGIDNILKKDLKSLAKCSRDRIVKNFSIEKMVKNTEREICAVL